MTDHPPVVERALIEAQAAGELSVEGRDLRSELERRGIA